MYISLYKESGHDILDTFISIKEIENFSLNDNILKSNLESDVRKSLLDKYPKGFSIKDIIEFDKEYNKTTSELLKVNNITKLKLGKDLIYTVVKVQDNKNIYKNHPHFVFQLNLKKFNKDRPLIIKYLTTPYNPTSKKYLMLAWVRFTVFDDFVVLDEISSDMWKDYFVKELGSGFIDGWEKYTLRLFIDFVRHKLRKRKIYMPTVYARYNLYTGNGNKQMYDIIPTKLGFKDVADLPDEMLQYIRLNKTNNLYRLLERVL